MSIFHVCMRTNNTIINETTNYNNIRVCAYNVVHIFILFNIVSNIQMMFIECYLLLYVHYYLIIVFRNKLEHRCYDNK